MKKLYLNIIWHMHQPYYKDPDTDTYIMPWVYLHLMKDYIDMAEYYNFYDVRATFNYVPSLLVQIRDYIEKKANDKVLNVLNKKIKDLKNSEREFLSECVFWVNEKTIFKSYRYRRLYKKHKNNEVLDDSELLDASIYFLLSWTGEFIKSGSKIVKKLIQKERNYTEEDKSELLHELDAYINRFFSIYNSLIESGKIEFSTTPFYHPILPLLIDMNVAYESKKDIRLPDNIIKMRDEALAQVFDAYNYIKKDMGFTVNGFWPAEGSVSNDTLRIFSDFVKWTATDEDILSKSLNIDLKTKNRELLYKRYIYKETGISVFFRDKVLSDKIGFTYSHMKEEEAVKDFIDELKNIYDMCEFDPVVSVILDGENAWEYYEKNGFDFFHNLYGKLSTIDWLKTVTPSEILKIDTPVGELENIVAGSWIYGDFTTWCHHPEKNRAFSYLFDTYRDIQKCKTKKQENEIESALRYLRIAEGSDWFWWYGDDHFTTHIETFDYLFRENLKKVYECLSEATPTYLLTPIKTLAKEYKFTFPKNFISPQIDGRFTTFFEYLGAGSVQLKYDLGAMNTGAKELDKLLWGFNKENLYLAVTFNEIDKASKVNITIVDGDNFYISCENGNVDTNIQNKVEAKLLDIFEAQIPLSTFRSDRIYITVTVEKNGKIVDKAPVYKPFCIILDKMDKKDFLV